VLSIICFATLRSSIYYNPLVCCPSDLRTLAAHICNNFPVCAPQVLSWSVYVIIKHKKGWRAECGMIKMHGLVVQLLQPKCTCISLAVTRIIFYIILPCFGHDLCHMLYPCSVCLAVYPVLPAFIYRRLPDAPALPCMRI
jgi:hypothetical protein